MEWSRRQRNCINFPGEVFSSFQFKSLDVSLIKPFIVWFASSDESQGINQSVLDTSFPGFNQKHLQTITKNDNESELQVCFYYLSNAFTF
jgi:hypothetical protein